MHREYGVPLLPPIPPPTEGAAAAGMPEKALHPTNIRRSALALQYHATSMPAERRERLTVRPSPTKIGSVVMHACLQSMHVCIRTSSYNIDMHDSVRYQSPMLSCLDPSFPMPGPCLHVSALSFLNLSFY